MRGEALGTMSVGDSEFCCKGKKGMGGDCRGVTELRSGCSLLKISYSRERQMLVASLTQWT